MRLGVITAIMLMVASGGAWLAFDQDKVSEVAEIDIADGRMLYSENCAACHGADLSGQPDWRTPGVDGRLPAPPHDDSGHTWHHGDGILFSYTKLGGKALMAEKGVDFDSGMPGFGDRLSDQQIRNILAYIRSTWPERIRQVQAGRSKSEMENGED